MSTIQTFFPGFSNAIIITITSTITITITNLKQGPFLLDQFHRVLSWNVILHWRSLKFSNQNLQHGGIQKFWNEDQLVFSFFLFIYSKRDCRRRRWSWQTVIVAKCRMTDLVNLEQRGKNVHQMNSVLKSNPFFSLSTQSRLQLSPIRSRSTPCSG